MSNLSYVSSFRKSKTISSSKGLRSYMIGVYNYMSLGLFISGLSAFYLMQSGIMLSLVKNPNIFMATILGLFFIKIGISQFIASRFLTADIKTLKLSFFVYTALTGVFLATSCLLVNVVDIFRAFFITSSVFLSMSIYGYTSESDLTGMSSLLYKIIFGIIITSIISIFIPSTFFQFIISIVTIIAISLLVSYETQKLKNLYYSTQNNFEHQRRVALVGAFGLYINFIIIFQHVISLFARRDRD